MASCRTDASFTDDEDEDEFIANANPTPPPKPTGVKAKAAVSGKKRRQKYFISLLPCLQLPQNGICREATPRPKNWRLRLQSELSGPSEISPQQSEIGRNYWPKKLFRFRRPVILINGAGSCTRSCH